MTFQLVAYQLLDENISPDIAKVFGFLKFAIFHIFLELFDYSLSLDLFWVN